MPYEYLDHEADVGIRGIGISLAEAFEEGAKAVFGIMANLETVASIELVVVECEAPNAEALFVEFLNELLFLRETYNLLLSTCRIKTLCQGPGGWHLNGVAWGEHLDPEHHEILTEVKAATYAGLKIFRQNEHYAVQCVVDV